MHAAKGQEAGPLAPEEVGLLADLLARMDAAV